MIALDYRAMEQTPIGTDPFPHLLVPEFVPPASLPDVFAGLPDIRKGGSFPIEALRLSGAGSALTAELQGARFRSIVAARFGLDLSDAPTMLTLRGQSRDKDGQIHRDSDSKRVTVLLYLNPPGAQWDRQDGCLRLLRGPDRLDDYAVEVPPTSGALLVFPNGPNTWHGHKTFVGPRTVFQLNYMTNDHAARSELRRHRVSALLKGKGFFFEKKRQKTSVN
jgi:hypothetical protein